jgi:hypothetical protein
MNTAIDRIIDEQINRMMSGQLHPDHLTEAVRNELVREETDLTLWQAGLSDSPGRNWEAMDQALRERNRAQGPSWGNTINNAGRDVAELVTGTGQLLGQAIKAPLHPVQSAKFIAGGWDRMLDPQAWRSAYRQSQPFRSQAPEEAPQPVDNLGRAVQVYLAGWGKGLVALAQDPKRRLSEHPLNTVLDVAPLYGGLARGLSAGGRLAAATRALPNAVRRGGIAAARAGDYARLPALPGNLTRSLAESDLPGSSQAGRVVDWFDNYKKYRRVEDELLQGHFQGEQRIENAVNKTVAPLEALAPGRMKQILEGRYTPEEIEALTLAQGKQKRVDLAEMQGRIEDVRALVDERSTGPLSRPNPLTGKKGMLGGSTHAERVLAPLKQRGLERPPMLTDAPEAARLRREIEATGGTASLRGDPAHAGPPVRRGNEIVFAPYEPVYVPDQALAQGARPWDFLPSSPRGQKPSLPPGKKRRGLLADKEMEQDVSKIYRRHFSQVSRYQNHMQFIANLESGFKKAPWREGDPIPKGQMLTVSRKDLMHGNTLQELSDAGYGFWDRDGYLKFYRAQVDLADQLVKKLTRAGEAPTAAVIDQALQSLAQQARPMLEYLGVSRNDRVYFLPKPARDRLVKRIQPKHWATQYFVDGPVDVWRQLTLGFPRWVLNNLVGNTVLNTLRGVGAPSYARAAMSYVDKNLGEAIPESVKRGFFATEKRSRHLGEMGSFPLAREVATVAESPYLKYPVGAVNKVWFNIIQKMNTGVEDFFRRANYLKGAYPAAKKAAKEKMKQAGGSFVNSAAILNELQDMGQSLALHDPVLSGIKTGQDIWKTGLAQQHLNAVNEFLFDYSRMAPVERRYFRSIVPFWSWYRNIGKLLLTLPVTHPNRARLVALAADIGNERAEDFPELPEYMASSVPVGEVQGVDKLTGKPARLTRFLNTRAANPFQTILEMREWPNSIHPALKAAMETASNEDLLTHRPLKLEGQEQDFTSGNYWRYGPQGEKEQAPGSGGLKTLAVRLANQVTPLRLVLNKVAGGERYGDSFSKALPGEEAGTVRDPFNLAIELRKLSGLSLTDVNLERAKVKHAEEEKRTTSREWDRVQILDRKGLEKALQKMMRRQ